MNASKKTFYLVATLIIVGGVSFVSSQRENLLGLFTAMTDPYNPMEDVNMVMITTSIEDAAKYAEEENVNSKTAADAAAINATDAETAWNNSDRDGLSTAQYAAEDNGDDSKTASDNSALYAAQAQAFYDADYNAWKTSYDDTADALEAIDLAHTFWQAAWYNTSKAHGEWYYAKVKAYIDQVHYSCSVYARNDTERSACTTSDTNSTAYSETYKNSFDACLISDEYNQNVEKHSSTCVSNYNTSINNNWTTYDTTSIIDSIRSTYSLDGYEDDYNTKNATLPTFEGLYNDAVINYTALALTTRSLDDILYESGEDLTAALASADEAATQASKGLSSKNLANSYKVADCTSLTLSPNNYEMLSTDTSAAFDLTASVSTADEGSAWNFSLKNLMTFNLVELQVRAQITGTIKAIPVQTYDAQTKWFGTLVFKTSSTAGVFSNGRAGTNPLQIDKTDTTDTTVSFSGGVAGDVIRAEIKDEKYTCSASFTITQAGTPAVTVTESSAVTTITEGGATDTYTMALTTAPTADVSIAITPDAQATVSPSTLTFTSTNWATAQTVTVTAIDDTTVEGTHSATMKHVATSTDLGYKSIAIADVIATVTDNDTVAAAVTITESSGSTAVIEGSTTDTYTAVLTAAPTADVAVTVSPDTQVSVVPSLLTFTSTNWATAQTVTVTAIDDTTVEGTHSGVIKHTVASTDTTYNGLSTASVTATITDNDTSVVPDTVSTSSSCGTYLPFIDVADDYYAYNYINQLYCHGVIIGRSTTLFVPDGTNGNVSYAELVKMIDIALLEKTDSDGEDLPVSFSNVHSDDWFRNYWAIAEEARVVRSYDAFAYSIDPNASIPREVAALYVARALGATATNFPAPFSDVTDLSDPYAYAIYALSNSYVIDDQNNDVSTSIVTGVDETHFNPDDFILRSEAAALIYRASLSDLLE